MGGDQTPDLPSEQSANRSSLLQRLGALLLLLTVVAAAGAGAVAAYFQFRPDSTPPGPTTEELLLAALNRTEMSPVEIDDRLEVAESLCLLDEAVLLEVWTQLEEPSSLSFQDFVVAELCPDRAVLYAEQTGRYVTQEAVKNRVLPTPEDSTTSTSTTSTSRTSTSAADTDPEDPFSPEAVRRAESLSPSAPRSANSTGGERQTGGP